VDVVRISTDFRRRGGYCFSRSSGRPPAGLRLARACGGLVLARDSASERRAAMPDKSTSGSSVGAQPITGRAGADRCARNWAKAVAVAAAVIVSYARSNSVVSKRPSIAQFARQRLLECAAAAKRKEVSAPAIAGEGQSSRRWLAEPLLRAQDQQSGHECCIGRGGPAVWNVRLGRLWSAQPRTPGAAVTIRVCAVANVSRLSASG
jgi:hypothetical protein